MAGIRRSGNIRSVKRLSPPSLHVSGDSGLRLSRTRAAQGTLSNKEVSRILRRIGAQDKVAKFLDPSHVTLSEKHLRRTSSGKIIHSKPSSLSASRKGVKLSRGRNKRF